jgi:LacI family transcriptional regulator
LTLTEGKIMQNASKSVKEEAKVTLQDVAQAASVSLSTASKALTGKPRVSETTRKRVKAIAERMGYQPNAFAQSLVSGKSNTIGLITADLRGRFSVPILVGAEQELGVQKTSVLLANSQGNEILEDHHIRALLSRNIDGLIVVDATTNPRKPVREHLPIPVVYAYAPSIDANDYSIICDNVDAGALAARHLLSCGKTKQIVITGPKSFIATSDRVQGIEAVLHEHNLELVREPFVGPWDESWGRSVTQNLIEQKVDFDGIIAGNDQIAHGCLDALNDARLSIPSDVSVIGHDNWDIFVSGARPPLTSIDNQLEQIGTIAASRLMDAINGNPHHGIEKINCQCPCIDPQLLNQIKENPAEREAAG